MWRCYLLVLGVLGCGHIGDNPRDADSGIDDGAPFAPIHLVQASSASSTTAGTTLAAPYPLVQHPERHHPLGAGAQRDEVPGQAVGARVELGEAQRDVPGDERGFVRAALGL